MGSRSNQPPASRAAGLQQRSFSAIIVRAGNSVRTRSDSWPNPSALRADTSRREFLATAAGFTLALTALPAGSIGEALADAPLEPNVWLTIATDGTITIVSPAAEMGQGTFTTLPLVLAEELDADWSAVKAIFPPRWNEKKFGNPQWNGLFNTTASLATRGYFKPMRIAGAQARRVLIDAVAARWGVPVGGAFDRAERGGAQGFGPPHPLWRDRGFCQGAGRAAEDRGRGSQAPGGLPLHRQGSAAHRAAHQGDGRRAATASTCRCPACVYAAVLQSPYEGGTPATIDDAAARAVAGHHRRGAIAGRRRRRRQFGRGDPGRQAAAQGDLDRRHRPRATIRERALEEFAAIARDKSRAGVKFAAVGDAGAAMAGAARVFRGEYRTRYTYHAQMEPMNATAAVAPDGKSAEIWVGTQNPSGLLNDVARLLQTERSRITFHQHFIGGGYGRRGGPQDVVLDAVRLAKAVGSPVKVIWSREDDIATGKFRPMTAHHIEAGFDAAGKLIAWHHRVVAESVAGYRAGLTGTRAAGDRRHRDEGIVAAAISDPQQAGRAHRRSARRAALLGARRRRLLQCVRGRELPRRDRQGARARTRSRSASSFREGQPRVQDAAARRRRDVRLGASRAADAASASRCMEKDDTLAAGVAEVSLDRASGKIKVHNIWAAIDAGIAVQPRNLAAQTEGSIVFGLGHVLREKITIKDGRVQETNFSDYQVPRMSDMPNIEVRVISTDNPPTGAGEDGLPLVGGAIGNAVAALTGVRLRELPFAPERVKGALGA